MSEIKNTTLHVGLDDHKAFVTVAHAEAGRSDPPVFVGPIGTRHADIDKLVRRLHSKAAHLVFAYEAGPCGYGLYRYLVAKGETCRVVAPSLTPKRSGQRVKTNRRDALELARLSRSGDLVDVWVPSVQERVLYMDMLFGPDRIVKRIRSKALRIDTAFQIVFNYKGINL